MRVTALTIGSLLATIVAVPGPTHAQSASGAAPLVVTTSHAAPVSTPEHDGFDELVIRELFRRIGMSIRFERVPAARALINLNEGVDDAILPRTGGLVSQYPNIVQLEEPVRSNVYVAFATRGDMDIDGWQSLARYRVAYINGWKIVERNVAQMRSVTKTRNAEQLLRLVEDGRADVGIVSLLRGLAVARTAGFTAVRPLDPPLARRDLYFYLHRRHEPLVKPLSEALRALKADGTWQTYHDRTIGAFLNE